MPRTDAASRVIAAPAERVYAALVDPEALVAWLPPEGMTAKFDRFNFRPGGSYRLVLSYADAAGRTGKTADVSDVVEARYVEVVPGQRIVQDVDFVSDDAAFQGTMRITWQLTPLHRATLVEIVAADVPSGISVEDHAAGLSSSLANLARHLER